MKRGFIRGLWGIFESGHRTVERRYRVEENIRDSIRNRFREPFRTYVFGKQNYDGLVKMGVEDCILLSEEPFKFNMIKYQYRNKLEILKYAMEEDGYDEIVYMDWDCFPKKKIKSTFWTDLGKKEIFQANLQIYHRKKCFWRPSDPRKVPNGGFVYLRDRKLPSLAIKYWETMKQDNDEPAWAKLTDEMVGGWQGMEKYWDLFEPMCCNLHRCSPYASELLAKKDVYFVHYQGGGSKYGNSIQKP